MSVTVLTHGLLQPPKLSNGMLEILRGIQSADDDANVITCGWTQYNRVHCIAERIRKLGGPVTAASHSWGAWMQSLLFHALDDLGVEVQNAFFADPVTRPPGGTLTIPPNVRHFHRWYKAGGLIPTASIQIADCEQTSWLTDERVDVRHPAVDDDPAFIAAVVACATKTD